LEQEGVVPLAHPLIDLQKVARPVLQPADQLVQIGNAGGHAIVGKIGYPFHIAKYLGVDALLGGFKVLEPAVVEGARVRFMTYRHPSQLVQLDLPDVSGHHIDGSEFAGG